MKQELICISCPIGCHLTIGKNPDGSLKVTGNQCPKGENYAAEEMNAPKRIVTATVSAAGNRHIRIPVRTDKPLPVEQIQLILDELYKMKLQAPVRRGDLVIENFLDTDVNVVTSMTVE